MNLQSNKRSQTKSSSARRKDIYKKSKYYQEKRQKLLIATGIGIFVLVFILIHPVREHWILRYLPVPVTAGCWS